MTTPIVYRFVTARPNVNISWFPETLPESHFEYIRTKYADRVKGKIEVSEDGLVHTVTFEAINEVAFREFLADGYLIGMAAQRDAYNAEHGIIQIG